MSKSNWLPVFSLHVQNVLDDASWLSYSNYRYNSHYKDVEGASIIALSAARKPLSIYYCKEEDLPEKTDEIREAEQCFCKMLIDYCPLMHGETLQNDFFTYLLAPVGLAEKYTAILLRKTSMAELLYTILSVKVQFHENVPVLQQLSQTAWAKETGHHYVSLPTNRVSMAFRPLDSAESVAAEITKNLLNFALKKVVSDVGMAFLGPIGAMGIEFIFGALFPPSVNPFQELYEKMIKVVRQELRKNDIEHINGTLANIGHAIQAEYTPMRKELDLSKQTNRELLMDLLQKYDSAYLVGMLGLLEQKDYQKIGLGVYILGQTLRLTIYQECATIYPAIKSDGKFFQPLESSYGKPITGTVAQSAKEAAEYVQRVWPEVLNDRAEQVYIRKWYGPGHACIHTVVTSMASVKDDYTGDEWLKQEVGTNKSTDFLIPQKMKDLLAVKKQQAKSVLTDQMGDPDRIVSQWKQLIEKPLHM